MKHIGVALLHEGKPAGLMRALCGAVTTSVLPAGATADDVCPECKRLQAQGA
jgi:hypothetical protein